MRLSYNDLKIQKLVKEYCKTLCLFGSSLSSFLLKTFVKSILKYTYTLKFFEKVKKG